MNDGFEYKKDGFFYLKDKDYFAVDAVSNSFLINFDKSPAHALLGIQQTPSMRKGSLIHALILDDYDSDDYIIVDCTNRSCNEYKDAVVNNPDKKVVIFKQHMKDLDQIEGIRQNLYALEIIPDLKFGDIMRDKVTKKEICGFYYDSEFELLIKCKIDILFNDKNLPMFFDLKKAVDPFNFQKSIIGDKFKYYRQAGFYSNIIEKLIGIKPLSFFVALEDVPPYGVKFYEIPFDLIDFGMTASRASMQKYKDWKDAGSEVKAYRDGYEIVEMPGWFGKKYK